MNKELNPDDVFDTTEASDVKSKGKSYIEDYNAFISALQAQGGLMAAGEIGEMIARMSHYFGHHNVVLGRALKHYNEKAKEIYSSTDEQTGKPLSAAKAEILAAATPEGAAYQEAKIHVQNIEQNINALKALQRGVLNEHNYSAA